MEKRFDKIDAKLDEMDRRLQTVTSEHQQRLTKVETSQKGVIYIGGAIATALITAIVTAISKLLHL